MFLTKILSTSKNVPSDPLSSILKPSPVIPDMNVDVPIVFVSAILTLPEKVAELSEPISNAKSAVSTS